MKTWKFIAGALLVLAGFSAGVGWNFFSLSSTVHGATGDPNPALKSVTHDGTLAGDGTTTAPLGIANGGVSAPKLSTSATPSPGQVLGFNGSNLAWQNAPVGGVRALDSLGHEVGPFEMGISGGIVYRRVGAYSFILRVGINGFTDAGVTFYHTTSDCTETRYLLDDGTGLVRGGENTSTRLFYTVGPLQQITYNSFEDISPFADPTQPGTCHRTNPEIATAGSVTTFDLSTLNLTPPFHLEF